MTGDDGLVGRVRRGLGATPHADPAAVASLVRAERPWAGGGLLGAVDEVSAEIIGAGVLEPLLRLPGVTDVLVNGPGPVWVDGGEGLVRTEVVLGDEAAVRRLAQRLVAGCGRRLDDAAPYADARLPDGTRVHAVLPPVSPQGTCLSLRIPPRRTFTLDDLVGLGALPPAGAERLRWLVESRLAFVVSGGTGSGKTTVLSTLLSLADRAERLVLVEDAAELRPAHPHVVRLEARLPNAENAGAVGLDELVRQALRMRPDRLVVGEVRGAEVVDLLAALNTGHEGGCGTVHANAAAQVPARFEALGATAGLPREATHAQLAAGLQAVVHLRRHAGRRVVDGVAALRADGPYVRAEHAWRFTPGGGVVDGPAAAALADLGAGR
jgi:pilus assembly protein CpaF